MILGLEPGPALGTFELNLTYLTWTLRLRNISCAALSLSPLQSESHFLVCVAWPGQLAPEWSVTWESHTLLLLLIPAPQTPLHPDQDDQELQPPETAKLYRKID